MDDQRQSGLNIEANGFYQVFKDENETQQKIVKTYDCHWTRGRKDFIICNIELLFS